MLNYNSKDWHETARGSTDFKSLLFSAPDNFNMTKGQDRRLRVASADFSGIGTSLLSVRSSGHEIDLADNAFLTVMMPTRGRTLVRMGRKDRMIAEGCALALGPSERWTRVEKGPHQDFQANLAKISLKAPAARQIVPFAAQDPVVAINSAALAGFRALILYMFNDLASPKPMLIQRPASDLFAALVAEHLRALFQTDPEVASGERPQRALVRRAEEFMAANLGEPLTVPIIAEATDVSVRQLQDAFRHTLGQTPWDRLTARRLERARQLLLSARGTSVTEIAFDCGFSHLGRFAQVYRSTFGEAPSATLRRASRAIGTAGAQNG